MADKSAFHETYVRAAGAVAFVAIIDTKGDQGIGSAFHIGNGIFVTARHVIDGVTIKEIATTKSAHLTEEAGGKAAPPRRLEIVDGPYFGPEGLDVAVFRVDLGATPLPAITVSQHTDYSLGENDLVLADILVVGYPPIPFTTVPSQVVTLGQINAVVRVRHSPVLHFIASAMARGGFSGGVALDQSGVALALVAESLGQGDALRRRQAPAGSHVAGRQGPARHRHDRLREPAGRTLDYHQPGAPSGAHARGRKFGFPGSLLRPAAPHGLGAGRSRAPKTAAPNDAPRRGPPSPPDTAKARKKGHEPAAR